MGSVFSPHYHRANNGRRARPAQPMQHCAINVALYPRGQKSLWAFCERTLRLCRRSDAALHVGRSSLGWHRGALRAIIDEQLLPWGKRLTGTLRFTPSTPLIHSASQGPRGLDAHGRHFWWPAAPCGRIEVDLPSHNLRWSGRAYHDANCGAEPLARAIRRWSWQRLWHPRGTQVHYAVQGTDGPSRRHHAQLFLPDGSAEALSPDTTGTLPTTAWGLRRSAQGPVQERQRLEDTPFYSRALVRWRAGDTVLDGMHEQVDMVRFVQPWVQCLLPFRLRRQT